MKLFDSFINTIFWDQYKNHDSRFYLVCKIVDHELFDEFFPVLNTKYRTQPSWDFYKNKGVIKIEIDPAHKIGTYDELLDSTDLDIPFFKSFSEIYIYIHYNYKDKQYINIYKNEDSINEDDFIVKEIKYKQFYACFLDKYNSEHDITDYLKMYLNNKHKITPELLLNNYDKLDESEVKLYIFDGNYKIYTLKETISLK
jgi:hypothetical protein